MTTSIRPDNDQSFFFATGPGALAKNLQRTGKLPPVSLELTPLNPKNDPQQRPKAYLDRFLTYQFNSSVLIPVDIFSFTFAAPDDKLPINQRIKTGDIVTLRANQQGVSTGIIDQVEWECDREFGEKVTITGRNMLSQLEDQEVVNPQADFIPAAKMNLTQVFNILLRNTRINPDIIMQNAPQLSYLFATEPGESKLAALQRYLEPLNIIAWMAPNGQIKVGKPAMQNIAQSTIFLSRQNKNSNVMDMRITRNGTQIPSIIMPLFSGSENVPTKLASQQVINGAVEPTRLRVAGHVTTKNVVVSNPNSGDPSEFPIVNSRIVATQTSQNPKNILYTYAQREVARQNINELQVQVTVPGHYDDHGIPFVPDSTYRVTSDRGDVDEVMYLYEVQYQLDEGGGQRSTLHLCRLGTIVSNQAAL